MQVVQTLSRCTTNPILIQAYPLNSVFCHVMHKTLSFQSCAITKHWIQTLKFAVVMLSTVIQFQSGAVNDTAQPKAERWWKRFPISTGKVWGDASCVLSQSTWSRANLFQFLYHQKPHPGKRKQEKRKIYSRTPSHRPETCSRSCNLIHTKNKNVFVLLPEKTKRKHVWITLLPLWIH